MICSTRCADSTLVRARLHRFSSAQADGGRRVLFLHGSAGAGNLWRTQVRAFEQRYGVATPDLIGYGRAAPWPAGQPFSIADEVQRLEKLLCGHELPFHLVGYSYGGAVALSLALANPRSIASLTLIEPVVFQVLRYANETSAYEEASERRREFATELGQQRTKTALRLFLGYWTGPGSWERLPESAQRDMLASADKALLDWTAAFDLDPGLEALGKFPVPSLLIHGGLSPLSTQRITAVLKELLPLAHLVKFSGAGHTLPLTHARELTDLLESHFASNDGLLHA